MIEWNGEAQQPDDAVLVAVTPKLQQDTTTQEYLDELAFLAETLGLHAKKRFSQKLENPDIRYYIGKGKLEEVKEYMAAHDIEVIVFDDELSPSQVRNLEKALKVKIYDRSLLILDIFLKRAKTAQAKTQVELARYQYLLPRLTRMWTHLERQRGGTGTRGGAGEKEIETDRRIIRNQVTLLKEKLKKIDKQNATQRKGRQGIVRVSLVGYTNVGKSSLMRRLSKSEVFAENKLFATVDSTVRRVTIDDVPFLMTDTVGFIRKLPHTLVECFKSTLDEVRESDVLLHVVDISHPSHEEQMQVVEQTLNEIGAGDKDVIKVYNKADQLEEEVYESLKRNAKQDEILISVLKKDNIQGLKDKLIRTVAKKHFNIFPNYLKERFAYEANL